LEPLAARLHAVQGWKDHPGCLKRAIKKPIIITGVPRTGTTVLHKLLSMDNQFQGLERWLTESPMPRPPRETWHAHPSYQKTVQGLEQFFTIMPDMRSAHDMVADEVDECLEVLHQCFISNRFSSSVHVPAYDEWFLEQSERASYRHYAKVVQLIGDYDPNKRWLLKNPGHVAQMDALLEVFPDACVIHTHRDPVKAIPSLSSTLWMARRMHEGDNADPKVIGASRNSLLEAGGRAYHRHSQPASRTVFRRASPPVSCRPHGHRSFDLRVFRPDVERGVGRTHGGVSCGQPRRQSMASIATRRNSLV
jgi:hypothetical protein